MMVEMASSNEVDCVGWLEAWDQVGDVNDEGTRYQVRLSWASANFLHAGGDLTGRSRGADLEWRATRSLATCGEPASRHGSGELQRCQSTMVNSLDKAQWSLSAVLGSTSYGSVQGSIQRSPGRVSSFECFWWPRRSLLAASFSGSSSRLGGMIPPFFSSLVAQNPRPAPLSDGFSFPSRL